MGLHFEDDPFILFEDRFLQFRIEEGIAFAEEIDLLVVFIFVDRFHRVV